MNFHKRNFLKLFIFFPLISIFMFNNREKNSRLLKLDNKNKILWYLKEED